jgi:hypothetical protein
MTRDGWAVGGSQRRKQEACCSNTGKSSDGWRGGAIGLWRLPEGKAGALGDSSAARLLGISQIETGRVTCATS